METRARWHEMEAVRRFETVGRLQQLYNEVDNRHNIDKFIDQQTVMKLVMNTAYTNHYAARLTCCMTLCIATNAPIRTSGRRSFELM